jgi:hypothetical protein
MARCHPLKNITEWGQNRHRPIEVHHLFTEMKPAVIGAARNRQRIGKFRRIFSIFFVEKSDAAR